MKKTKITIDIHQFPQEVQAILNGADIYDTSCRSDATVLYSDFGYYIKIDAKGKLQREARMTEWFARLGLGVELVVYVLEEKDYMVTKSAEGEDATHWLNEPEKLCEALADAMRKLHQIPVDGIDVSPCMDVYKDLGNNGKLHCDTLIHGDFCLPNVMLKDWEFQSFIDVGLAGVGDRHIDLFWALWSLEYNLKTDEYCDYFLERYGRERVNLEVLRLVEEVEMGR